MQRVFLDANILFSAAYREAAGLLRLWKIPGIELVTSEYASHEAYRNLDEPEQHRRLALLLKKITVVHDPAIRPILPEDVMLPLKDKPILHAALSVGASVLITGDVAHFGRYYGKRIEGVRILPPADFLHEMLP